jgi:hypothetical protein
MKRTLYIQILLLALLPTNLAFGQIDSEDLSNIFAKQGIHVFKYPFLVHKGEYMSISYEIYENEKLIRERKIIEDFQKESGLSFDHHLARKDTTVLHRLYFFEEGDSLLINTSLPGISGSEKKIDISKVVLSQFSGNTGVSDSLSDKKSIMYYRATYGNSDKYGLDFLDCATGLPDSAVIKSCDFVILFFAERIKPN